MRELPCSQCTINEAKAVQNGVLTDFLWQGSQPLHFSRKDKLGADAFLKVSDRCNSSTCAGQSGQAATNGKSHHRMARYGHGPPGLRESQIGTSNTSNTIAYDVWLGISLCP
jgi:hypothetical protein